MKTVLKTILFLSLIFSCSEKHPKIQDKKTEKQKLILVKVGFYPSFHPPAETILNLNEKYLIFYSPSSYIPAPPPPPRKDGKRDFEIEKDYQEHLNERPELQPFKSNLTNIDINRIQNILNSFNLDDFSDKNIQPALDGMSTNIVILHSDGKLIQINPFNDPKLKQRELYGEILNLIIEKNTNKKNSIILQNIKGYR